MERLIDIPYIKEQTRKIFFAANEFYNNYYARENKKLSSDNIEQTFARIHKIAQSVGDWEISDDKTENFPLVTILVAYVRAMLIDRFPFPGHIYIDTDEPYKAETEYYILIFIYLYVRALNPEKTKLLQLDLLDKAADIIVVNLFHFRYICHDFNRMFVNLIDNIFFLYNRLYEAEMFNELYNRTALNILWQNYRSKAENGVIMLDGDHFKEVNDKCGHNEGDNVLKIYKDSILRAIDSTSSLKARTYPARWGGEEFVVCVYNSSRDEVIELAKKIKSELSSFGEWDILAEKYKDKNISFPRTVSQGVAFGKKSEFNEFKCLIEVADKQLYMAKDEKLGNRDCIYYNGEEVG